MTLISLSLSFLCIGLFAIGGGLATIPFIQQFIVVPGWIPHDLFYNMIAISESTPGPIGINLASYVGFDRFGVLGAVTATFSVVLPSFLIILFIAKFYGQFTENRLVKNGLYGIRAAVSGLIATAAYSVLCATVITPSRFSDTHLISDLFDFRQLIIFAAIFALYKIFKKHPIWYILFGALAGIVFL